MANRVVEYIIRLSILRALLVWNEKLYMRFVCKGWFPVNIHWTSHGTYPYDMFLIRYEWREGQLQLRYRHGGHCAVHRARNIKRFPGIRVSFACMYGM